MKRKLILVLISLTILGASAYYYFDTVFLPVQFKQYVLEKSEKYLNRKVSIETIDFVLFKGFIVKNFTVQKKSDPNEFFIKAEEVTFNFLLTPLFKRNAVIIPNIKIKKPSINILRASDGNLNFSDLTDTKNLLKRKDIPVVLLRKLTITNGTMIYNDQTQDEPFTETHTNIEFVSTLSINKGVRFEAQTKVPKLKTVVRVRGSYDIIDKNLRAQVLLDNLHVARYLPLNQSKQSHIQLRSGIIPTADMNLTFKDKALQIKGDLIVSNTDLHIGATKQLQGTINIQDMVFNLRGHEWDAKGLVTAPALRLSAASGKIFSGNVIANLNLLTIFDQNMTSQGDVTVNNAYLKIDEHKHISGNVEADNTSLSWVNDAIHLQGNIDINDLLIFMDADQFLKGNGSAQETELSWSVPDAEGSRRLNVESKLILNPIEIEIGDTRLEKGIIETLKTHLAYDDKKITIESQGQMHDIQIKMDQDKQFQGSPHFNIFYHTNFKDEESTDYNGSLRFTKSVIRNIPRINEINTLEGIVTFDPKKIETERLTFNTQDANILVSGFLYNYDKPRLNIKASSENILLQNFLTLAPEIKEKINADIAGKANITARYTGKLNSFSEDKLTLDMQLSNASIAHESLNDDITNLSGDLQYSKDLVTWANLLGNYNNKTYTLRGQLSDFSRPIIDAHAESEHLSINTQIKLLRQALQFIELNGNYLGTTFDLKGDMHFFDDTDPDIDLRGTFDFDLQDIGYIIPKLKYKANQIEPVGVFSGEGIFKGKLSDWRNWQFAFDATSEYLSLRGYPFENTFIRYTQRDQTISKFDITSTVFSGQLTSNSQVDLRTKDSPFTSSLLLENVNLKKAREHLKSKNNLLAGTVSFSTNLKGTLDQWRDLTGEGSLNITEGHLWQWKILNGISSILLIPEFKNIVFTDAHSDFTIYDQRIHTENARLSSQTAILDGKGSIDFNQNLDFNIVPTFSKLAILQSDSSKKKATSILTQTDGYLNIKLKGTLKNPKPSLEKSPLKIIKKTIGGTTGTIKEVIGNVVGEVF